MIEIELDESNLNFPIWFYSKSPKYLGDGTTECINEQFYAQMIGWA